MRKFIIASVSVLALSASAYAEITEGGGGPASAGSLFVAGNTSDVEQIGSLNTATVGQTSNGGSNTSNVYQSSAYGNGHNSTNSAATVTQIGAQGATATSTVTQNDYYQQATVNQTAYAGSSQTSTVTQNASGFTGTTAVGNSATVTQTANAASTQTSTVTQTNDGNSATVSQTSHNAGDNQQSRITQSGIGGFVSVTQAGPADNSTVSQSLDRNNPRVWYSSATGVNGNGALGIVWGGVVVNQDGGSANTSTVTQNNEEAGVSVKQTGSAGGTNGSRITQNAGGNATAAVSQTAVAGVTNSSEISQTGYYQITGIQQDGTAGMNTSTVNQGGVGGNDAGIWQSASNGISNSSTVNQTGYVNTVSVRQH